MTQAVPMAAIDKELRILSAKRRLALDAGEDDKEIMKKLNNTLDHKFGMAMFAQAGFSEDVVETTGAL